MSVLAPIGIGFARQRRSPPSVLAILALSLMLVAVLPARAEKRVALLIGNNLYESVTKLQTAVNDARAVGAGLRDLGFSVSIVENQSRRAMSEALLAFDKAVEPGDTAFFFFAGHGFEISSQNYLLPTDVPNVGDGQEELMQDASFPAARVVERLQARGARTVILVLDACRNNPFEHPGGRGLRGSGGLAAMTPDKGVFIMYSAGAKQTALDQLAVGENATNSLFTRLFVKRLGEPDLTLVQLAKRLQVDVRQLAATVRHDQTPAYYDQVVGDVVLNPSGRSPQPVAQSPAPMTANLDALAAAKSWRELGTHLTDVQPTARDAHWASLAEQAAVGDLTASLAEPGIRLAAAEHYLATFPTLRSSQTFLALRASIGLDAFGTCFEQRAGAEPAKCLRELEIFVRSAPQDGDLARNAARLVARIFNRATAAAFYVIALETLGQGIPRDRPPAVCADSKLVDVVIPALGDPAPLSDEAKAAKVITGRCWDALSGAIVAQVAREQAYDSRTMPRQNSSAFQRRVCPALLERNALTGLRAAICREVVSE
jgi:Caspase domain